MADDKASYPTTIGADAVFKGQLQFDKGVRLLGKFDGEINSKGELVIAEGANLETARLEVAEGAVLIGRVSVGVNSKAKPAEAAKAGPVLTAPVSQATGKPKPGQPTPAGVRR